MQKLISFDLDQTLVNALEAHVVSFLDIFKKHGLRIPSIKRFKGLLDGRHSREIIHQLYPRLSKKKIDQIRKERRKILKKYKKYMKPIPGAKRTLQLVKKKYKIAIITNAHKDTAKIYMKKAGITPSFFDIIIGVDDVKKSKPNPEGIIKAEHLFHVKSDIHVGDSPYDIIAAKKAKAISVAVLTGGASRTKLKKYKPDFIIKDVTHLPKLLKKLD